MVYVWIIMLFFLHLQGFPKRLLFRHQFQNILHLKISRHWSFPKFYLTLAVLTTIRMAYSRYQLVEHTYFCKITQDSNKNDMYFQFTLNRSAMTYNLVYGRSDHTHRTSSIWIVLQLIRGDRVWIKMILGGRHYWYGPGGDQSFSGFML